MFELTRKYEFHAARKLTSLPESHPCSKMHGHTFSVIVKISGNLDESKGWVMDFSDIDDIYHTNVQSLLDHKYLNDVKGLNNPTSENLCVWIWNNLKKHISGLKKIRLSEDHGTGIIYEE